MSALLARRGLGDVKPLALLGLVCAATGVAAAVKPTFGVAAALGLAFTVAVFADLLVGVALFTTLSFLEVLQSGGAGVSFMKAAGLLLFLSWAARASWDRRQTAAELIARHPALAVSAVALVSWSAVSAAWAESPGDALTTAYRFVLDLLLIPIVYSAVRERRDAHLVVAAFIAGAVASATYGILTPVASTDPAAGRLTGALGEANQQATVLVAALVMSVCLTGVVKRSRILQITAALAGVLAFVGMVGTLSRAGLVSFACVLAAGVVVGGRWRRSAAVLLVLGALGTVGYFVAVAPQQALQRVTMTDTSGRSDIWTVGWRMFSANPVVGVGAGNFQVNSIHYLQQPGAITAANYIVDTPKVAHNIYLEQLADLGVPGLMMLLGVFAAAVGAALKAARIFERIEDRELELLSRCLILALVAFMTADFFASEILSKQLWVVIALCPAMLGLAVRGAQAASSPA